MAFDPWASTPKPTLKGRSRARRKDADEHRKKRRKARKQARKAYFKANKRRR